MEHRYKPHHESDGTWAVIDGRNGRPAEMGSRTVIGTSRQEAEELAELFNKLETQRQERKAM
ncbi:hypothetical protein M2281_002450 [Mesorhizobium soli]|uniref:hypothetical protein n=1 Tax=Pseudaminobacter soli (ex Li et al. 2025) TaxID=1295366 RepID=UPI0024746200|nr:hypothetical protein [Mesorhizobium soli]MDH6231852.1 hypothetical protein [Mesorhizobium soli]